MRFAATRDQLSAAQVDMLSRLQIVDSEPVCAGDGMACSLAVAQAGGATTNIDSIDLNTTCNGSRKVVSFESFDPFRRSLDCQYAKNLTFGQPNPASPVPPDARCFNGLFVSIDGGAIPVPLQVDDATLLYHIELDDCVQPGRVGKLSFSLRDSDGTVLGMSNAPADAGPNGTCATRDQAFPHPGTFQLEVTAAAETLPGHLFLRFF